MGQNEVFQKGGSDSIRIPKWTFGCAVGFMGAVLIGGIVLLVLFLTPDPPKVVEPSEPIIVVRDGTGNSGPKLDTQVALDNYEFPVPESGDNNVVSVNFPESTADEFVWKMTLTHPDTTFEEGVYGMKFISDSMTGYSDDICQVISGRLTCSFVGRSQRFSETSVKIAVTKNNGVVTSFWGKVWEQNVNESNGGNNNRSKADNQNNTGSTTGSNNDDQSSSDAEDSGAGVNESTKSGDCPPPPNDGTVIPYDGTVSLPIISDWEAGKPLKVEFDFSGPVSAISDAQNGEGAYVLLIGDYPADHCEGVGESNPNRLTCEISFREEYANTPHLLYLAYSSQDSMIGLCTTMVQVPGFAGSDMDCSAFQNSSIEIAWPEWKAGEPLPITFKFPGPVPGLEPSSGVDHDYQYSVKVSDPNKNVEYYDQECEYLGYTGKLHCYVPVDSGWSGSIKAVELSVSGCGPVYQNSNEHLPLLEGGANRTDDHHDDDDDQDDHHH
ncbi:MAG: hypothetical protein JXA13_14445 [Anaerolineales bacterium]|nr:hypothetical protein [Anaerolineales bacterium]